jgi:hypothetical protein
MDWPKNHSSQVVSSKPNWIMYPKTRNLTAAQAEEPGIVRRAVA